MRKEAQVFPRLRGSENQTEWLPQANREQVFLRLQGSENNIGTS
jgi:hypothetical protein